MVPTTTLAVMSRNSFYFALSFVWIRVVAALLALFVVPQTITGRARAGAEQRRGCARGAGGVKH